MPEIGATLHDARLRRKIDITQVEAETKIRAKYLRALEEEEWDLLPGPTYVKTFLRTYGEYLDLDAKLLVEEYKQRFERPTPQELTPFSTNLGSRRERRRARGPIISPGVVVGICVLALVGLLAAIGTLWGDPAGEDTPAAQRTPAPARSPTADGEEEQRRSRRRRRPRTVQVQIRATGPVSVCLRSRTGRALINTILQAGQRSARFRGRRFRVAFGNGNARIRYGNRSFDVPEAAVPLGFDIRPGRAPRRLPDAQRPTCG
ncbi:MAG: helix-turn-helix domain-containing protein [Actinomycetota bacterium]|nr:helix-turn-helix domain-containing protein [Actinomycetota bacterium]